MIAKIIWDNCRNGDGTISLRRAARQTGCKISERMDEYLQVIEEMHPIVSRQVAAVAVANALALDSHEPQSEK